MENPLLQPWDTPFGIAPFAEIDDAHYAPAVQAALAQHLAEIDAIATCRDAPSFDNTIKPLEAAGQLLERVLGAFFTVAGAHSTPERQALQRQFSPQLAAHSAAITSNAALFSRIEALWQARDDAPLPPEEARVLMLTYRSFIRAGAALQGDKAQRMTDIKSRLAVLGTEFTQNLLADEGAWHMVVPAQDLQDLPQFLVDAAHTAGAELGLGQPVITTSRSLATPFLQTSPNRALREKVWRAFTARGANGGATDNRAIATEILALRKERAALLGYDSFAEYKLETEMAKTPQAVRDLLMAVWAPARAQALRDAKALEDMLLADGQSGPLEPWDWHYYSAKRRQTLHNLDEAALKPYLQLDRMIEATFACANRLFGLEFTPLDVPLYHPDCRAWQVTRAGLHVAVFIGDYFARASKRSGAWCSAMRMQARHPEPQTPIVLNVCNFAKASPSLLSYDDARTLFHEFGHALHQMLSDVTYGSVAGTSVARDFVELPSQLFEHWLEVPQVLAEFATHVETGAPMPSEMLETVLKAANFDQGFQTVEFAASALVDLEFHLGAPPADPMQKQAEVLEQIGMPRQIAMRHATPHFAHVFAGDGYSAGYYSYMWSEVMDADAFDAFIEAGDPFDPETAKALEAHILSRGGSVDAGTLYQQFRGRMPGVEALLKGRGLVAAE